jgi:8-oxo-dGTP pyrophosphatase MutT (NUDIX family)
LTKAAKKPEGKKRSAKDVLQLVGPLPKGRKKAAARKPAAKKEVPAAKQERSKAPDKEARPRKQFGVLALRVRGGAAWVMLVTSRGTRRWIIPKGNPEKGKTGAAVAAIEAFEEAGLIGEVWNRPIGDYLAPKHLTSGKVVNCNIQVYRMDVEQVLDDWPEKGQRERQWYPLDQAAMMVGEGGLVALMLKVNAELIES